MTDNGQGYNEETILIQPDPSKWPKNKNGKISGKFTKEESELIRKAVEDFCAMKQISVARLCSECDHKAELKGAWMEIAKCIPYRSVQSVYRHGLRQLHPFKRGAWSEEECEMLVELVSRMGKKWAAIQQKLNRSADSCRDKYREMNDSYVRGRWKENETEQLKLLLRQYLNAPLNADIETLGQKVEAEGIKIPWSTISKKMGKRSRLACFKKWQKMTGLFSPSEQFKEDLSSPSAKGGSSGADTAAQAVDGAMGVKDLPTRVVKPTQTVRHSAPTAGAAAAIAAGNTVNNPIADVATGSSADYDLYLLSELANLGVGRTSDVDWDSLRYENAHERWNELFEEWQATIADEDLLSLPLSEIAQLMHEEKASAQRAAETVEAVDLPNPESLNTREV